MIIGKYQLVLLKKTFFSEPITWYHYKALPKTTFFEKCGTFCQPRSHDAIKITYFFIQILKVEHVSFKLITKYLNDVGDISRNQVLFFEKLSDCTSFGIHNGWWQKIWKKNSEKMLEQHIRFNFLKSKVTDLAAIYQKRTCLWWVKKIQRRLQISQSLLHGIYYFQKQYRCSILLKGEHLYKYNFYTFQLC